MFCKPCKKHDKSNNSNFVSGCQNFRKDSLTAHEKSKYHIDSVKKDILLLMKENKKTVFCSYKGEINSESTSNATEALSGCSNVIGAMDLIVKKMSQDELKQIRLCFNTAYWIAKKELSFNLYPSVLDLQEVNGVKLMDS